MPTQTTLSRVESFPFDSRADGYDADGYPVYDRAVGASMLRETFKKFFSDGVFPSPGDALQIAKGSGLTVTIQPGIFIIRGAMGGYLTDAHSLTLDTAAPQGNVCYGIMLRYDETEQHRSCYLRVVRGDAGSSPQPPAPDQSTPGVMEYRLGYVTVPSGSGNLNSATVTNEKGASVCPYAAPFEEIDVSGIVSDFRSRANEYLMAFSDDLDTYRGNADRLVTKLVSDIDSYYSLIASAIDGTTAGSLQEQINELKSSIGSVDLTEQVDNETIGYSRVTGGTHSVLHVLDGSIGKSQLAYGIDVAGGLASADSVFSAVSDLATIAYELHRESLSQIDGLDTIVMFDFPDDVSSHEGQYDSSGNKYYASGSQGD